MSFVVTGHCPLKFFLAAAQSKANDSCKGDRKRHREEEEKVGGRVLRSGVSSGVPGSPVRSVHLEEALMGSRGREAAASGPPEGQD